MAKVDQETVLDDPEVDAIEDDAVVDTRPTFNGLPLIGGLSTVFDTVEAKTNPVTYEDGTVAMMESSYTKKKTGEKVTREVEVYKLFEIRKINPADNGAETASPVAYLWSRSNQAALAEYAEIELSLECGQFGTKRGRSKLFKPDAGVLALAHSYKQLNDQKAINMFLAALPQYRYVFEDQAQPESI